MSSDCTQNTWWIQLPLSLFLLCNKIAEIYLKDFSLQYVGLHSRWQYIFAKRTTFCKTVDKYFSSKTKWYFKGNNTKWIFYEWAINLLYFFLSLFFRIGTFDLFFTAQWSGEIQVNRLPSCSDIFGNLGYPSFKYF